VKLEDLIREALDVGYRCGEGTPAERRAELERRCDDARIAVLAEIAAHKTHNLDIGAQLVGYEFAVRKRMAKPAEGR
jgi:hypothetical protein